MRAVEEVYKNNKSEIDKHLGGEVIFTALSGHVCRWIEPSEYAEWKDTRWNDIKLPIVPKSFIIAGSKEKYSSGVLRNVKQILHLQFCKSCRLWIEPVIRTL